MIKDLSLHPEVFAFDRRQFTKLAGGAALGLVGSPFIDTDKALAAGLCEKVYDIQQNSTKGVNNAESVLQYWVDGRHLNELSPLPSRANLVLFVERIQQADNFVEVVLLADSQNRTLGSCYFDASDKLSSGHVPYVIFENVALNYNEKYNIYYQVRNKNETKLYKYVLENAQRSYLNKKFLPTDMQKDFANFMGQNPGLPTTPLQYYTYNGLATHSARGYIKNIGSDGQFEIDIELMHGDANAQHYMRYFIVADPVGRLLGFVRRNYVTNPGDDIVIASPSGGTNKAVKVGAIDADQRNLWKIGSNYVANINDCPYIQIFTEDVFDALARTTVRLA